MVVPVLMTSCQVSDHANSGPVRAQTITTPSARLNVGGCPAHQATRCASPSNRSCMPPLLPFLRAGSGRRDGDLALDGIGDEAGFVRLVMQLVQFLRRRLAPSESRSEEHTSELQSLMRISYAVFCLK